jgi:hypothetical protein
MHTAAETGRTIIRTVLPRMTLSTSVAVTPEHEARESVSVDVKDLPSAPASVTEIDCELLGDGPLRRCRSS